MSLRKADYNDLKRVMEIKNEVVPVMRNAGNTQWSDEYPDIERFTGDLSDGSLYVYEEDEHVKGFVVADDDHPEPYRDLPWELTRSVSAAMHRMAVDPNFQGHGIAKKMIVSVEEMLASKGYKGIHTDTSLENEKMQMRFEKNGYKFKGKLNLDDNKDDWYAAYEKVFG